MTNGEDSPTLSEESVRAKRAILPHMRHELRTPINAIIGYSEMLLEDTAERGDEAKSLRSDLTNICSAGRQLLSLVNDTKSDVDLEVFSANFRHAIRTMINTIVGYTEMLLEDAGDKGEENFSSDLLKIQAAGKQLFDLIEQFVKFGQMEAGKDNLYTQGKGAVPEIQGSAAAIPPVARDLYESDAGQGSLLVVDDNKMNRDLLSRCLKSQGYTITMAENGRQALEMIATQPFDLVLLDLLMPEINGYQVLQTLKENTAWRYIPVIILSAMDEVDDIVRCLEMGADDYLPKPFDRAILRSRIESSLEKKRLREKVEMYRRQIEEANRERESRVEEQAHPL